MKKTILVTLAIALPIIILGALFVGYILGDVPNSIKVSGNHLIIGYSIPHIGQVYDYYDTSEFPTLLYERSCANYSVGGNPCIKEDEP